MPVSMTSLLASLPLSLTRPESVFRFQFLLLVVVEEFVEVEMLTEPIVIPAHGKKVVKPKRRGVNRPKTQKAPPRKAKVKTASRKLAPKKKR